MGVGWTICVGQFRAGQKQSETYTQEPSNVQGGCCQKRLLETLLVTSGGSMMSTYKKPKKMKTSRFRKSLDQIVKTSRVR